MNIWIATSIVRELMYAQRGEQRFTLVLDLVSNVFGLFCLLRIVATGQLVDLSLAQQVLGVNADGVGALLGGAAVLERLREVARPRDRFVRRQSPAGDPVRDAKNEPSLMEIGALIATGVVGALACTWSDTYWFSAVEGEVYALSTFFITFVFWCIMKWEASEDERHRDKYCQPAHDGVDG